MAKHEVIRAAGGLLWKRTARGERLAVIHRPRYGDWTLPKGKLERGEEWSAAALREVAEETGCRARLGAFAGGSVYAVDGRPKVVLFWHMRCVRAGARARDGEVDELAWLAPASALRRLQYASERALLRAACREAARAARAALSIQRKKRRHS